MWCCSCTSNEWDALSKVSHLEAVEASAQAPPVKGVSYLQEDPKKSELQEPLQFLVSVVKEESETVGLVLDVLDGRNGFVSDVKEGPILAYNEKAVPSEQIRVGDFIVEVNGVEGSSKGIIHAFKGATSLDLVVRRPLEFGVTLEAGHGALGLDLAGMGQRSLLILRVKDGAVQKWNEANPELRVRCNDRIIAVDGATGTGEELSAKVRGHDGKQLTLLISRPAPLPLEVFCT